MAKFRFYPRLYMGNMENLSHLWALKRGDCTFCVHRAPTTGGGVGREGRGSVARKQTPSTGLRHPSLEEGAGKRCSECGPQARFLVLWYDMIINSPASPVPWFLQETRVSLTLSAFTLNLHIRRSTTKQSQHRSSFSEAKAIIKRTFHPAPESRKDPVHRLERQQTDRHLPS